MTNLDNILQSRDVILPTKVHIVKAMVFPVVFHVWLWELNQKEGWAPNNWCLWIVVVVKTLESTLDCKEIKPVHPKRNRWKDWIFFGRTMLKIQYFGHLMRTFNSLEKTLMLGKTEGKRRRGQQSLRWLDSITDSVELSILWETVVDRGAWHAAVHGITKTQTQLCNWITNNNT